LGKSTLTVQLANYIAYYALWQKNVLVVDLDPQFNASQYLLGVREYAKKIVTPDRATVWNIFEQLTKTPTGGSPKQVQPVDAIVNVATISGSKVGRGSTCSHLDSSLLFP
jgi:chromosome partitioning protein